MPGAIDLLNIARGELGAHEQPPGSNVTKYGEDYGLSPAPWCAQFACSWLWRGIGLPIPPDAQSPKGWASVGFFLESAHNAGWIVNDPQPGDFAVFIWRQAETWPDHVGIVEDIFSDGSLGTIEGNIPGPDDVGDEVARRVRPRDWEILALVRPPYDSPTPPPTLNSPPAPPAGRSVAPYPRLSQGVLLEQGSGHHDLVAIYQRRMADRGWAIAVDGLFGPQTHSATVSFQSEKRLQVDGEVGPQTWSGAFELPVT